MVGCFFPQEDLIQMKIQTFGNFVSGGFWTQLLKVFKKRLPINGRFDTCCLHIKIDKVDDYLCVTERERERAAWTQNAGMPSIESKHNMWINQYFTIIINCTKQTSCWHGSSADVNPCIWHTRFFAGYLARFMTVYNFIEHFWMLHV